jgi:hypothetical protein
MGGGVLFNAYQPEKYITEGALLDEVPGVGFYRGFMGYSYHS